MPDFDACLEAWKAYTPGSVAESTVEEHVRGEATEGEKKAAEKKDKAAAKRKKAADKKKADAEAFKAKAADIQKDADEAGHQPEDEPDPAAKVDAAGDDEDDDFFS